MLFEYSCCLSFVTRWAISFLHRVFQVVTIVHGLAFMLVLCSLHLDYRQYIELIIQYDDNMHASCSCPSSRTTLMCRPSPMPSTSSRAHRWSTRRSARAHHASDQPRPSLLKSYPCLKVKDTNVMLCGSVSTMVGRCQARWPGGSVHQEVTPVRQRVWLLRPPQRTQGTIVTA